MLIKKCYDKQEAYLARQLKTMTNDVPTELGTYWYFNTEIRTPMRHRQKVVVFTLRNGSKYSDKGKLWIRAKQGNGFFMPLADVTKSKTEFWKKTS